MGLTIHYTIRWPEKNRMFWAQAVREARLRIARRRLGRVSPLRETDGTWAGGLQFEPIRSQPGQVGEVPPLCGRLFTLDVGEDCEPAVMGLCHYPPCIRRTWGDRHRLRGWIYRSFSKTQYAGLHGWTHFRRCHLAVIRALEVWRELGARVTIHDEGDYWPDHDEAALRRNLDQMNAAIAGAAGALKDFADDDGGPPVQSPIFAHPQFERLEAEGVSQHGKKIAALTRVLGRR